MSPGIALKTENSTEQVLEKLKPILRQISKLKASKLFELGKNKFKGSFYEYDLPTKTDKKELLNTVNKFIQENNLNLVIRITENSLFIGKSYAREIAFFKPPVEVIQSFVNDAIEKNLLTGEGYELYANPNMGIIARIYNGKVQRVFPVSGASINVETKIRVGSFQLKNLELGGWGIPGSSIKYYRSFIARYPESYKSQNSPYPYSMFNLMGTGKMEFYGGGEKLHFRSLVYPGTLHELPLGTEAGIIDDIYNQTTHGCLFVGEGKYKMLVDKKGELISGRDSSVRKEDIGVLVHSRKIRAEDIELGTELKMRNGGYATLSLDSYGNQVWLDENGLYVPFDAVNFDWNSPEMPQVVFMPPKYGESEIVNSDLAGKKLFVDDRNHFEYVSNGKLSVFLFPDRYGLMAEGDKIERIEKTIISELTKNSIRLTKEQKDLLRESIMLSQVDPTRINFDIAAEAAKR